MLTRGPAPAGEPLAAALARRRELRSYEEYLSARGLLAADGGGDVDVSPVAYWRNRRAILGRYGARCRECGTVQFPPTRTCTECGRLDSVEDHRLSDRGTLYTFTVDHLVAGRYVEHGVPRCVVELAFRRRGGGGPFHNYGWKCRPAEV